LLVLPRPPAAPTELFTVGHSTRPIETFLALLPPNGIATLADVRRFPGSRRYPQFGTEALAASLGEVGIAYAHFPDLGGRRDPAPDSVNTAWRHEAFRGYADYMETPLFQTAITRLLTLAPPIVVMCAEAVWWRCHRGLIADYLTAMGLRVMHIGDKAKTTLHTGTSAATLTPGALAYTPAQGALPFD
jgi:uncharacterized protein (DUF488 family)